jgi:cytochrome c-type biogenesis protein CcmF
MITELGHFALILALFVAIIQSTVPMLGAARRHIGWMAVGRSCALTGFALTTLAMLALMHAYVTSDFSVINVIENSHTDKPLLYRITGVWGNHEGSMLLWAFMLSLCSAAVAFFSDNLPPVRVPVDREHRFRLIVNVQSS